MFHNLCMYLYFVFSLPQSFQASISMWSKESDSTVNNKIAYFMTQSASLQLLDLPAFVQDTQVDTKVRKKTIILIHIGT